MFQGELAIVGCYCFQNGCPGVMMDLAVICALLCLRIVQMLIFPSLSVSVCSKSSLERHVVGQLQWPSKRIRKRGMKRRNNVSLNPSQYCSSVIHFMSSLFSHPADNEPPAKGTASLIFYTHLFDTVVGYGVHERQIMMIWAYVPTKARPVHHAG